MHLSVLRESQNKQRLFLYTALTYRGLKTKQRVFTARYELGLEPFKAYRSRDAPTV